MCLSRPPLPRFRPHHRLQSAPITRTNPSFNRTPPRQRTYPDFPTDQNFLSMFHSVQPIGRLLPYPRPVGEVKEAFFSRSSIHPSVPLCHGPSSLWRPRHTPLAEQRIEKKRMVKPNQRLIFVLFLLVSRIQCCSGSFRVVSHHSRDALFWHLDHSGT